MNLFLGCISEIIEKEKIKDEEDKIKIIKKIIKYIKLGGFIQVSKYKPIKHAYSLQNYKKIEEVDTIHYYFSILNPLRGGVDFEKQDIYYYDQFETNHPNLKKEYNAENCKNAEIIKSINENHFETGHMVLKDNIFIKWFDKITFSESMFGAKNILIENIIKIKIDIKVKRTSKICITVYYIDVNKINHNDISNYIKFNLIKINNNNVNEEIKFSDDIFINKIYEEINIGNYQLSFDYNTNTRTNKSQFYCQIKYYDEDMEITSKNIVYSEMYFPKLQKLDFMYKKITERFIPPEKNNKYFLHQDPRENNNIKINYEINNTLFWMEPPKIFDINDYIHYTLNYKNVIITTVYHLFYFVPIFIIIYYIEKKVFEILAPENESMEIDINYKILFISPKLEKFAKVGETLSDYNLNVKK